MDDDKNHGDEGKGGVSEVLKVITTIIGIAASLITVLKEAEPLIKSAKKEHGPVRKRIEAERNGKKGELVWDHFLYNEITFDDVDGKITSLFTNSSDKVTECEWNKLAKKYEVKE